jgi:MFS family permease
MTQSNRTRGLSRHPDFLRLWAAQGISVMGTEITMIALPLIAVIVLHAQPIEIAVLAAAGLLPFLILGLPAGVLVERLPRRPVMIACDLARAVLLVSVPVAAAFGVLSLPQLVVVNLGVGTCRLFFDVADTSFLPRLLDSDDLVEGNSKLYATLSVGQIAGPGLAGALLSVVTAPVVILADVATYLGSAFLLFRIRLPEPAVARTAQPGVSWRHELVEGLRHVLGHPLLRPTTLTAGIYNAAEGGIRAIVIVYMVTDLGLPASVAALTIGVGAVGFLFGSLVARRFTERLGIGRASIAAAFAGTLGPVLIPLAPVAASVPVLVLAWFITGFGPSIYGINYVSMRQAVTPDRLQARMNATTRFIVWGAMPLGAITAGLVGQAFGLRVALGVMAVLGLTCLPVLWFSAVRRLTTLSEFAASSTNGDGPEPPPPASSATSAASALPRG